MMRRLLKLAAAAAVAFAAFAIYILYPPPERSFRFPDGRRFAFSIVDDTDMATLERVRPIYEVLARYGLRTTKTVWVLASTETSHASNQGDSLQDADYLAFIRDLQARGFEIALHGARGGDSRREETVDALAQFEILLGRGPRMQINHYLNADNLYWGNDRWSFAPYRWAYGLAVNREFSGDDPATGFFWGDLAKERITYVNQFTFLDIDLLSVTPSFPYHLDDKPYVNLWFSTVDGDGLSQFEALLSPANLDRLERDGGICLVYTHFGNGSFNRADGVDPRFEERIRDLASRNGWFAPASEILDHVRRHPDWTADPGWREKVRQETLFLWALLKRYLRDRDKA